MNIQEKYKYWLARMQDEELLAELQRIVGDEAALTDRFYRDLEFGTGGLRGVLGAGSNRMNIYTVAKATQGYCNYLRIHFAAPSVAIAYDSRLNSRLFAEVAAGVFAANDILVYIYKQLMPTPALSFAVRQLACSGGIVITASHNPAQYNGYKVYGADGCQITTEAAAAILAEIEKVDAFADVQQLEFAAALAYGKVEYIPDSVIDVYLQAVSGESLLPTGVDKNVAVVYTPLNGTGISCVPRCLRENGFSNITIPKEQGEPNGNFPTCPYPNPEVKEALAVGLQCAKEVGAELLLATDPDCDRVGAAVKNGSEYSLISGNEMGVLLLDFVCQMRLQNGTMPKRPLAIKTIVTTPLAAKVAAHYGVEIIDVLTGFKFIGEQIGLLEQKGEVERYIFGFEESYGYLSGGFVRDKDAVNASLLICEMFAWYKQQGKTLLDRLSELYADFGYYSNRLLNFEFAGAAGLERMKSIMQGLRQYELREIGGCEIVKTRDYLIEEINEAVNLPKSDVLRYWLAGDCEVVVRPSGTEPKLKVYITATGEDKAVSDALVDRLSLAVQSWFADE